MMTTMILVTTTLKLIDMCNNDDDGSNADCDVDEGGV